MSTERKSSGLFQSAAPDISYARTLEHLRGQRRTPELEPRCTIGGEIEREVHSEIEQEREGRIKDMETRLTGARGHAESVFALANLKDRASHDFERSR